MSQCSTQSMVPWAASLFSSLPEDSLHPDVRVGTVDPDDGTFVDVWRAPEQELAAIGNHSSLVVCVDMFDDAQVELVRTMMRELCVTPEAPKVLLLLPRQPPPSAAISDFKERVMKMLDAGFDDTMPYPVAQGGYALSLQIRARVVSTEHRLDEGLRLCQQRRLVSNKHAKARYVVDTTMWQYLPAKVTRVIPPVSRNLHPDRLQGAVSGYTFAKRLGGGFYGQVQAAVATPIFEAAMAQQTAVQPTEAIKVVDKKSLTGMRDIKMLHHMITVHSLLSSPRYEHPNIAMLRQVYHSPTHLFFRMEYAGPESLYARLAASTPQVPVCDCAAAFGGGHGDSVVMGVPHSGGRSAADEGSKLPGSSGSLTTAPTTRSSSSSSSPPSFPPSSSSSSSSSTSRSPLPASHYGSSSSTSCSASNTASALAGPALERLATGAAGAERCHAQQKKHGRQCAANKAPPARPITTEALRSIMLQAAGAVSHMHLSLGACHRDLKLENFVVAASPAGSQDLPVIKLVDFDFARVVAAPAGQRPVGAGGAATRTRAMRCKGKCGTVPYVAPEVVLESSYDALLSDVWSLGILFLEVLCGIRVIEEVFNIDQKAQFNGGEGVDSTIEKIRNAFKEEGYAARFARREALPQAQAILRSPGMSELLNGMLTTDPARRWNIQQVMATLRRAT